VTREGDRDARPQHPAGRPPARGTRGDGQFAARAGDTGQHCPRCGTPRLSRGGGPLIEVGLLRSDPQLAARLSVFDRLCAGQAMPAWEQVSSRHDRIRQAAALTAETISVAAAAIVLFLRAVLALAAAVAAGGRARPPAQRRQRARPRPGSGRPAGPGGRA